MLVRWSTRPELNRLVNDTFGLAPAVDGWFNQSFAPAVDVSEDAKAFRLAIELPGVKVEDLKIEADGNLLSVSGEKKHEGEDKFGQVHRFERRYGSFRRSFVLPETVDTAGIAATVSNGVLTITLPKVEKALHRTIPVHAA